MEKFNEIPVGMPNCFEPLPKPFTTFPQQNKGTVFLYMAKMLFNKIHCIKWG